MRAFQVNTRFVDSFIAFDLPYLFSFQDYDEMCHLSDFEFSQRLELMRRIHSDFMKTADVKCTKKRVKSRTGSAKKRTKKKKAKSSSIDRSTPLTCEFKSEREAIKTKLLAPKVEKTSKLDPPKVHLDCDEDLKFYRSFRDIVRCDIERFDRELEEKFNCLNCVCVESHCTPTPDHCHRMHTPSIVIHRRSHQHLCPELELCDRNDSRTTTTTTATTSTDFVPFRATKTPDKIRFHENDKCEIFATLKRSKSCPNDLFRAVEPLQSIRREIENVASNQNDLTKMTKKRRCQSAKKCETNSKKSNEHHQSTNDAFIEFLSTKLVRSNLAANLREQWSRKKINELADRKLKIPVPTTKFIPKCHRWHVDQTPAWKSFVHEEFVTFDF